MGRFMEDVNTCGLQEFNPHRNVQLSFMFGSFPTRSHALWQDWAHLPLTHPNLVGRTFVGQTNPGNHFKTRLNYQTSNTMSDENCLIVSCFKRWTMHISCATFFTEGTLPLSNHDGDTKKNKNKNNNKNTSQSAVFNDQNNGPLSTSKNKVWYISFLFSTQLRCEMIKFTVLRRAWMCNTH